MGLWSGIKYALNSRLGTSTFKSLDRLIDDVQTEVAKSDTASASGTLSQKIRYTNSTLIGAANAAKGTATTGTVMGKLRAILEDGAYPKTRAYTSIASGKSIGTNTSFTVSKLSLVMIEMSYSGSFTSALTASLRGGSDTGGYAHTPLNSAANFPAHGKVLYILEEGNYNISFSYASGSTGTYSISATSLTA